MDSRLIKQHLYNICLGQCHENRCYFEVHVALFNLTDTSVHFCTLNFKCNETEPYGASQHQAYIRLT